MDGFAERLAPEGLKSGNYRGDLGRYLFTGYYVAGRSVADLCCGVGYGSNLLVAAGATKVLGLDVDAEAISTARRHYPGPDFEVAAADKPLELRDFDVCVCLEGIEHVEDPEQLLANMRGADLAIVSSPNAECFEGGFSGNPHHLREWTRKEFESVLAQHFSDIHMFFQWHHQDPLDQHWRPGNVAKAFLPIWLKTRIKPPAAPDRTHPTPMNALDYRKDYRLYPATYLSVLPPGLRYGKPTTWLAVCRR